MLSAPLLLSCDMAKLTSYEKKILQNLDLIAIGQDTLGIMAEPHTVSVDRHQQWSIAEHKSLFTKEILAYIKLFLIK